MSARYVVEPIPGPMGGWLAVMDTRRPSGPEAQFAARHRDLADEMAARLNVRELTAELRAAPNAAPGFRRLELPPVTDATLRANSAAFPNTASGILQPLPETGDPAHGAPKTHDAAEQALAYLIDRNAQLPGGSIAPRPLRDDERPVKLSDGLAVVPDAALERYGHQFFSALGNVPADRVIGVSELLRPWEVATPVERTPEMLAALERMPLIRRPPGSPTVSEMIHNMPVPADEPLFDDNDEIVVTFQYPTEFGRKRVLVRLLDRETFDAIVNQINENGVQP